MVMMVNFIVNYTKTKKIYRASTFVTKICIKNKSRHRVAGPTTLTRLHILPSSFLPSRRGLGPDYFSRAIFLYFTTHGYSFSIKLKICTICYKVSTKVASLHYHTPMFLRWFIHVIMRNISPFVFTEIFYLMNPPWFTSTLFLPHCELLWAMLTETLLCGSEGSHAQQILWDTYLGWWYVHITPHRQRPSRLQSPGHGKQQQGPKSHGLEASQGRS